MREQVKSRSSESGTRLGNSYAAPDAAAPAHILIVEDDPWVLQVSTRLLRSAGYEVTCASDGREALRHLEVPATPIDVVLLEQDVAPHGVDALTELRKVAPSVPVLIIADLPENQPSTAQSALLLKPFTRADVVGAIERLRQPQEPR